MSREPYVFLTCRWSVELFDSLLVFTKTNQAKTKLKKLITYRCKKLILGVFRAKMFFQHFMGYKIHFVNQTGSAQKWVLLIDVTSWFWAYFAPKYLLAVSWTIRSTIVNQVSSHENWGLLIDVKSWFWAFFAPKHFSAIFCYKLK